MEVSDSGGGTMNARRTRLSVLTLTALVSAGAAFGDGKVFVWRTKHADIFQPTQKVFIKYDGGEEQLVIQTKYEGPAEEMVWIVPVPSEPKVEKGDPNLFEELSKETDRLDLAHTYFRRLHGGAGPPARRSSPVRWRKRIGDYDVVLLRPVGGDNVVHWLKTKEFRKPRGPSSPKGRWPL
jgi:hypothetical protein